MPFFSILKLPRPQPIHGGCARMFGMAISFAVGIACLLLYVFSGR